MKFIHPYISALLAMMTAISCTKDMGEKHILNTEHTISITVDVADMFEDGAKVSDSISGSTHSFSWEKGDKIHLFAFKTPTATDERHITDLGTFVAENGGKTATFTGKVSNVDASANKLFAIYKDNTFIRHNAYSETYGGAYFYKIFNNIETEQTGNGIKHAIFASNTGVWDPSSYKVESPLSFKMSTPVIRFGVKPTKNISRIDISLAGAYFAGSNIQMRTNIMGLNSGWDKNKICISNGAILAAKDELSNLSFASSQIQTGKILTFKFTAVDGSVSIKTYTTAKTTVAHNIYYIGDVVVDKWTEDVLPEEAESAASAVKNMGMGTNLCCTFECGLDYEAKGATREDPKSFETMTARSETTQQTMNSLAAAGFKTIRIPVTWYPHMDNTLSKIDKVWLDRIGEVVQYAFNAGMYAIINVHADAGNNANTWLVADYDNYKTIRDSFVNIWGQIATYFRDYDYRLIFEGYNEIVDKDRTWFIPKDYKSFQAANFLNQDFVTVVRSTRGHNAYRNLCVNTFSAGTFEATLNNFVLPSDDVAGHLMVQVHSYKPDNFCTADLNKAVYEFGSDADIAAIDEAFACIKKGLIDKGYPVVLGEYGSFPTAKRSDTARGHHAAVYLRKALELGIAPLYWYNPMDYHQRSAGTWTYPILKDSITVTYNKYISTK